MKPDQVFAFSVDLLACSEEVQRACDVDSPGGESDDTGSGSENIGVYLIANLTRKVFEEEERHGGRMSR